MAELIFDKFHTGLVTHPSETELPPGAALKAENVNFDALGKLKSRKGYKLEFAGPTGITIIGDPFKYEFNLPGSFGRKEVILVYGQDGSSRDTLWWRPYWDTVTEAWIDGWQELTEFEGPYTAAAETSTTLIRDSSGQLDSAVDDYYNTFLVFNTTRTATMIITDYAVGANQDLTLKRAIASQASGDTFYVFRFMLSETLAAFPNLFTVEDFVRFYPRENGIEISLGSGGSAPLLFTFIRSRWYFNNVAANTFEGFALQLNVMLATPDSSMLVLSAGSGSLASDTYYFKSSFTYDGYQEGPLSPSVSRASAGTSIIVEVNIEFEHNSNYISTNDEFPMLDRRITHVNIYAAKGDSDADNDQFFLLMSVPITSLNLLTGAAWTLTGTFYELSGNRDVTDDVWNGVTYEDIGSVYVFGKFLRWDHNQGHKSKKVHVNYKFRATLEEQHYKAPVLLDEKKDSFVAYSIQANGSGVPVDDVIPHENFLNLSQKGIVEITGLASIRGFLVILTPNKIFIYAPGRSLSDFPVERGNIAERGFITVDDTLYFCASDDFYAFNGLSTPKKLMFGKILDQWQAISDTNKQSAFVGYSKKTDSIFLVVAGTIFVYDRIFDAWRTHTTDVTFIGFTTRRDGVLFAATASNIYELQSDSFTEGVTTDWESSVKDFTKELGNSRLPIAADVNKVIMKHNGDKRINVSLFDPSKSTVYPRQKITFFPEANSKPVERVVSFKANQLKVKIEDVDPGTAQPSSEIDYLRIEYEPVSGEF